MLRNTPISIKSFTKLILDIQVKTFIILVLFPSKKNNNYGATKLAKKAAMELT